MDRTRIVRTIICGMSGSEWMGTLLNLRQTTLSNQTCTLAMATQVGILHNAGRKCMDICIHIN